MAAELTTHELIAKHRPTLDQALEAIRTRAYWSPHRSRSGFRRGCAARARAG